MSNSRKYPQKGNLGNPAKKKWGSRVKPLTVTKARPTFIHVKNRNRKIEKVRQLTSISAKGNPFIYGDAKEKETVKGGEQSKRRGGSIEKGAPVTRRQRGRKSIQSEDTSGGSPKGYLSPSGDRERGSPGGGKRRNWFRLEGGYRICESPGQHPTGRPRVLVKKKQSGGKVDGRLPKGVAPRKSRGKKKRTKSCSGKLRGKTV